MSENLEWFYDLQAMRRRFVESVRENKFEGGVYQSAVEKYADPVHFIFELIQNAEDQEAKEVRFTVSSESIIFEHTGKPFEPSDVESITAWGNSDKPNQPNKIGRFGIGFKSVFKVTDCPHIYLSNQTSVPSFCIRDLFVPELLTKDAIQAHSLQSDYTTRFLLPLKKDEAGLFIKLISDKFETFSADALLFLSNIERLEWSVGNKNGICERKIEGDSCRVKNFTRFEDGRKITNDALYRIFERKIYCGEVERQQSAKLAFRLNHEKRIVEEVPPPPLYVFFPTEQQHGLKFRLHAPFLLSESRGSLKQNSAENESLVEACAALLKIVILELLAEKQLTVDFLNLLPISDKHFPTGSILAPLYEATLYSLARDKIIPIENGKYCRLRDARYSSDPQLKKLFSEGVLQRLYGRSLKWLHPDFSKSFTQPLLDFLDSEIYDSLHKRFPDLEDEEISLRTDVGVLPIVDPLLMRDFVRFGC